MKEGEIVLCKLYSNRFGATPDLKALPGSGGSRRYFRMSADGLPTVIGTVGTNRNENEDFLSLQGALQADGVRVPSVYAVSDDRMCYLQEDLGSVSLFSLLGTLEAEKLVERTILDLAHLQTGLRTFGTSELIRPCFNRRLVMWDLNYFKYCFAKPMEVAFDEDRLEDDFERMASEMTGCDRRLWGFMYRDCQSRNVMICKNLPCWIDFQGGRPGPMPYDVASLLWQARAGFSDDFRQRMVEAYAYEVEGLRDIPAADVQRAIYNIVPLRVLQTLGAYGFRGLTQRKEHFLKSISMGISTLHSLVHKGVLEPYPEIKRISDELWTIQQMAH